jgi:hypothetical protein
MATKQTGGMLWALDDAWSMDPPTVREGDADDAQTLWAVDAQIWDEEPQTSPDVGDAADESESGSSAMP